MRSYSTLSRRAQLKSMRSLARSALDHYGIADGQLKLLRHVENTTFRVRTVRNAKRRDCLLRIHGYQTAPAVSSECSWLLHLQRNANLKVPAPIVSIRNELCVEVDVPWCSLPRVCSLLTWLPGRQLAGSSPKPEHFRRLGRLMGRLHVAARTWRAPQGFVRPRWDWDGLFGNEGAFGCIGSKGWIGLPPTTRRLFALHSENIGRVMSELGCGPDVCGLIHADLHFGNVIFTADEASAIDFDDCGIGCWAYDIAIAMRPWRTDMNWTSFWEAFQDGYRGISDLPPGIDRLDLFIVARHIATTLWASSRASDSSYLAKSLDARCESAATAINLLCAA
jgi:Ser/Thr protein kinase RdoA (MazF antagonist)